MVGCVVFANAVLERLASTTSSPPSHRDLLTLLAPFQCVPAPDALRATRGDIGEVWGQADYG
jgi:hypothetical protein